MDSIDFAPLTLIAVLALPEVLANVTCPYIDDFGNHHTKICPVACCDNTHQSLCCGSKNLAVIALVGVFGFLFVVATIAVIIHCCAIRRRHSYHLVQTDYSHPYGSTGETSSVLIAVTPASPLWPDMGNQQPAGRVDIDVEPYSPDDNQPYPAGQVVPDVQPYYPAGQVDPYQNQNLQPYEPDAEPYNPQPDVEPYNPQPDVEPYYPQPEVAPYTPNNVAPYSGDTEPYNDTAPYGGNYNPAGMVGPYGGNYNPAGMVGPYGGDTAPYGQDTEPYGREPAGYAGDDSGPYGGEPAGYVGNDSDPY